MTLKYDDLYKLTEELQQLLGAQLQGVFNPKPLRYTLELRTAGETRLLILDLTPAQPFIVSTSFTKTKNAPSKTPVLNFLRAHFVNHRLNKIEMAEKPNRTVKLSFGGDVESRVLLFKCYPHGQHLVLRAADKLVNFPLRPPDPQDASVSFVEPEVVADWTENDRMAETFLATVQGAPVSVSEPYHLKLVKKLEKAVEALDRGLENQKSGDEDRIQTLQREAERLSAEKNSGDEIQSLFSEIKKIQKKQSIGRERRQELLDQIIRLKTGAVQAPPEKIPKTKKETSQFSGTRVRISEKWELWVGRTDWQNDDLLKIASSHDLWIHLRDYPGAHGVLRGPKKSEPTLGQVELAARVVAILSQSKKKPFLDGEKLDFIVTPKKFVKKKKGAAPGRVIVERETVRRIAFKTIKFDVIT